MPALKSSKQEKPRYLKQGRIFQLNNLNFTFGSSFTFVFSTLLYGKYIFTGFEKHKIVLFHFRI